MVGIGLSASVGSVHCAGVDGSGASSFCGVGPRQVRLPWSVSSDLPASPAACCLDTSGEEDLRFPVDQMSVSSPCLNLDNLSSSDDYSRDSVGLSDLSITLLCNSEEIHIPVNSDQVLSDVDLPTESVLKDKRQVIWMRASSPDVQIVDTAQVGRACDSPCPIVSVASRKRMPGKVSRAISRAPLTLDMTVVCTSGVATTSVPPPVVTSVPAVVTATVTIGGIDASAGSSDVAPVPVLEPQLTPVGESVPAVEHSPPPLSESPDLLPVVEVVPAIDLPSSPFSGRSSRFIPDVGVG